MSKTLIIAEKPSVALDISRALGGFKREGDFFESDTYVLSSSVGHLLTLIAPNDPVKGKWSFTHLPVIPPAFDLKPSDKRSEDRLKLLLKLIKRKDVTQIINACDAGREGELIFRYILQYAKTTKPVARLWLQSMTPTAIRDAFQQLRTDETMKPLEYAARARAEADWLVGINGTRAMTAFNSKDGGFFKTPVGRVQTPTLALVMERDITIKQFVSRDYWEVTAEFIVAHGSYTGKWFDAQFKKDSADPEKKESRLWSKMAAQSIEVACRNKEGTVSEESKPSTQAAPLLFDLTSLQREANARFGFSAKTTLALAQALYEKHKVLTYPRTDSRHLPEDMVDTCKQTVAQLSESAHLGTHAKKVMSNQWIKPSKKIFDNKKVSDHFAIIPTQQLPKELSDAEAKLYDLVARRFLAIFYPAAEFQNTTRITKVSGHHFKTEGKVLIHPGWMEVYGKANNEAEATLIPIRPNETTHTESLTVHDLFTKPPAHYNEATLLSAMESAGKLVEHEELREAMSEKGLGTPATRAGIIEGLLSEGYMRREGRDILATAKAKQLMTLLTGLKIEELTSAELTGEWEFKLKQIEQGKLSRSDFIDDIARMTQVIIKRAKEYEHDTVPGDYAQLQTPCPQCGSEVHENYRRYACTNCDFSITKHPGGRTFEPVEVEQLLRTKELGPLSGFISKQGRPFSAILRISEEGKLAFDFGQDNQEDGQSLDLSSLQPIGACPKCQHKVFDTGMAYICEQTTVEPKACDFRSGKVILQQEIVLEQMQKLLNEGKTDLLTQFISTRTRRPFKAHLVLQKDGKVGFEFALKTNTKTKNDDTTTVEDKPPAKKAAKKAAKKTSVKSSSPVKAASKKTAAKKTVRAKKSVVENT